MEDDYREIADELLGALYGLLGTVPTTRDGDGVTPLRKAALKAHEVALNARKMGLTGKVADDHESDRGEG